MDKERSRAVLREALRKMKGAFLAFLLMSSLDLGIFLLYGLDPEPFLYGELVMVAAGLVALAVTWNREREQASLRERMLASPETEWSGGMETGSLEGRDLSEMIRRLGSAADRLASSFDAERQDMLDYYTTWVHQIKTPIAVMRMTLGREETDLTEELSMELFRIEQYVDMVLQYIRLGSENNDLVIREYPLDDLIRESIRKYAPQFIGRRLRVNFEPAGATVITDKKWFACILEQILSNAVKYTPTGGVSIRWEEGILKISDTGIGIAPEDLPRIFEKGYTGSNGRMGMRSSGLGLYLCSRAADKLHIGLKAESKVGEGTAFLLDLRQEKLLV